MKKGSSEFINKFRLLNSQENSQEITWSSSDSSDYENISLNKKIEDTQLKIYSRKRKLKGTRIKSLNNISNLDITYDNTAIDPKQSTDNNKSPILKTKCSSVSPILFNTQCFEHYSIKNADKSPILSFSHGVPCDKSPVLVLKTKSPKHSPKVRNKLFSCNKQELDIIKTEIKQDKQHKNDRGSLQDTETLRLYYVNDELLNSPLKNIGNINNVGKENSSNIFCNMCLNDNSKLDLINKNKSYFDNYFSPEPTALASISEYESTQNNSRTSEEIENFISLSCESEKTKTEIAEESIDKDNVNKPKKIRYKKDGLAYRLNSLLKKQNASISLWNHERFLANNSNFTIPKGDYTAFRIKNVQFKYGCYLIDAKDVNNDSFTIIINNIHVNNITIEANVLLKLYKPFKCLNVNNRKLIVSAFKFECDKIIRK